MKEFIFYNLGYIIRLLVLYFCVYGVVNRICSMIEHINGIGIYYIEEGDDEDNPDDTK